MWYNLQYLTIFSLVDRPLGDDTIDASPPSIIRKIIQCGEDDLGDLSPNIIGTA